MKPDPAEDGLRVNPELVTEILCRFLRTELRRAGFHRAVVGLSGGIDSSVVTFLAARALGAENVLAVTIPYKTSSEATASDSRRVIEQLGVPTINIPITDSIDAYFRQFPDAAQLRLANKCARERMTVLYDQSAAFDALVAGTSNKSELLLGYGTQFGDMASAVNPVGDLYKTQLGHLAAYLGVPESICSKPPTGDLWVGQTDEGELGFTYAEVDRLLVLLVDRRWRRRGTRRLRLRPRLHRPRRHARPPQPLQRRMPVIAKLSQRTMDRDFRYAAGLGNVRGDDGVRG